MLAHGRDPYFPGWPDTLQLDYSNPAMQEAMIGELSRIELSDRKVRLKDLAGRATYDRDGNELASRGLYIDLPAWGYHVFEMTAL